MAMNLNALIRWDTKDPADVADYVLDRSPELEVDETILTSSWSKGSAADQDITIVSSEFSDTAAKVWLSGGADGKLYVLTNRITTSGGRTLERSVLLMVANR